MPENKQVNILIASGASAGHLYPALALAQALRKNNPYANVAFVSSKRGGLEISVRQAGYKLFLISVVSFSFRFFGFLPAIYGFIKSFFESLFIIEKFRPGIVVGFGSYVSFPVVLGAAFLKKRTVIHEQNVSLGLANRILSLFADKVALSFKETQVRVSLKDKFSFTGNPVRTQLIVQKKEDTREFFGLSDKFTILVLGGSQGSHRINSVFKETAALLEREKDFQFIHITGKTDYPSLKDYYSRTITKTKYCIFDFLSSMDLAYSLADLVICRAGAGTIAELAYFGKASISIPYPLARGHQLENALTLMRQGAAVVVEEKSLYSGLLYKYIIDIMEDDARREGLGVNIQKFSSACAADNLAQLVLSECKN